MINRRHGEILEARGLDLELLERLGLASCDRLGADTIMIPYCRDGKVVNHKYRTIDGEKQFAQDAGAEKLVYNFDCLLDETLYDQPLIITEGEFDCIAALQAGFPRTVSVPDGAPATAIGDNPTAKYGYIDSLPKSAREAKVIILAVDNDDAGAALMSDLGLRLGRARCKWVRYPRQERGGQERCKDLNEVLIRWQARAIVEALTHARDSETQWVALQGVYRMSELPPLKPMEPHDSGFPGLREHYRLRLGDLCVVTGVPGAGKSTFVNDLCCRMAMRYNWGSCFASFEQIPQLDHRRALRTWHGSCPVKDMDRETLGRADAFIEEKFVFLYPGEDTAPTLDWLLRGAADAIIRYSVRIVVLDPWNEIEHQRDRSMTMTEYVGCALRELKAFARKYEIHLIVVAHPQKLRRDNDGHYPVPSLYEISDSAMFANRADIGVIVHQQGDDQTMIRVSKSRYHDQIGIPGDTIVRWVWQRGTYEHFVAGAGGAVARTWNDQN